MRLRVFTCGLLVLGLSLIGGITARARFHGTNGRITFARFIPENNGYEVFSIRADGSDEKQLTFDPPGRTSYFSDWSPDGSRIAYTIGIDPHPGSQSDILIANADGSHPVNLTNNGPLSAKCPVQLAFRPKWAPDGTKFVFMHYDCEGG